MSFQDKVSFMWSIAELLRGESEVFPMDNRIVGSSTGHQTRGASNG